MTLDGRAELINATWMRLLCETKLFRFCARCLLEGYHSLYFQIEALKLCPIHLEPLRSNCSNCGRSTPPLALWAPSFEKPLCCNGCSAPLAGMLTPARWLSSPARIDAINAALNPIVHWLKRLRAFEVKATQVPLSHLSLAGKYGGEHDPVAACAIARSLVEIELPDHMIQSSRRPLTMVRCDDPAMTPPSLLAHHYWPSLIRMYRLVKKELFAFIVAEHRDCLAPARKGVWMQVDFGMHMLIQERGLCPVAAGYVRWIRKALVHLQDLRRFLTRPSEDRYPAPDENLRLQLMAEFYSCLAAAYVCEELNQTRSNGPAGSGLASDFMHHCSSGTEFPSGYWLVCGQTPGSKPSHWMVLGDASLLATANPHIQR